MGLGKTYSTKYLLDSNNSSGVAGQVLSTTSTGIDWVNANTVPGAGLWLANGNDIYNSNSGNVGIKTTVPASPLDIGSTQGTGMQFLFSGSQQYRHQIFNYWNSGTDSRMDFNIGRVADATPVNVMSVGYGGNVGIGTTTPAATLDVVSSNVSVIPNSESSAVFRRNGNNYISILSNSSNEGGILFGNSTDNNDASISYGHNTQAMSFATADSERMRIDSTGNVGIGNTNPIAYGKFVVDGTGNLINANASSGAATFQLYEAGAGRFGITTLNGSAGAKFTVAGTERMRITSAGNVGIGTTSPTTRLTINGDHSGTLAARMNIYFQGSQANRNAYLDMWASEPGVTFNGSGIGSNILGTPYYGKKTSTQGMAYIRFLSGTIGLWTGTVANTVATERISISDQGSIKFNAYSGTAKAGTPTYILGTDASGNVVKVLGGDIPGGGGTVTGTGAAGRVTFWTGTNTVDSNSAFTWDNTNKFLGISHWTTATATPAVLLHLFGKDNDIDIPQIRIEGRENPGDTRMDIAVKDAVGRFNLIENTGDANAGYGLMTFKTNAIPNSAVNRGGFNFEVGGTGGSVVQALTITNQSNINIGTPLGSASSDFKLLVQSASEDLLNLYNSTDGLDALISFTNPGGTLGRIQGIDNGGLGFDTGNNAGGVNSNAMFISNAASVGIGTTSPGDIKLQVVQTVANWTAGIKNYTADGYGLRIDMSGGSGVNAALQAYTAAGTGLIVKNNGLVGIGTFNPDSKLEVITSGTNSTLELDNSDTQYTLIQFNAEANTKGFAGYNSGFMLFGGESSIDTRLQAGGSYALSINASSRNVSIGSTSDFGVQLAVDKSVMVGAGSVGSSTTNSENTLTVKGKNNYSDGTTWFGDYGQILLSATTNMTGSARQFLITNALDNTKFAIVRSVDTNTVPVVNSTDDGSTPNSGIADFVIDNTGNIGIGTALPASKLEVSGRISGGELGSSDVCRNGLLFYVDFNDKACVSGTLATEVPIDLGPQNLQMSLVGGANFEYKNGIGCYYFDGSNDHILIQDYVVADTVNSYEIWHYAVAQATYETWWDSGTERPLLGTYNDDLIAYPAYNTTSLGDKINLNKWYHVVWAMNGNNDMDIFVNGKRTHEGLTSGMGQRTGTFNAQLGGDNSAETTNGLIAITRTYSRQLTPEDVLQNYNAEVERFAPVTPSLGIVQSYGNVGIGTTTPQGKLSMDNQIQNSGSPSNYTQIAQNVLNGYYTTGESPQLYMRYFDMACVGNGDGTNGGGNIRFLTNPIANDTAVERMRISHDGRVAIRTPLTVASSTTYLAVRGDISLVAENTSCDKRYIQYHCPDDKTYNVLGLEADGLTVSGRTLHPSNGSIVFQNQQNNNQFYIRNAGGSSASFQIGYGAVGSNTSFFINGAGNIGMGNTVTTNSVKLEITGRLLVKSSDGVSDLYLGNYAVNRFVRFHTNNADTYFDMNCGHIYWRVGNSTKYDFDIVNGNMQIDGTLTQNSDIRIKENVVEIGDCISKVQAMRGVYYNRTDFNTEVTKVGVIAQEVETVLPELILESPENGLKSVAYSELTAVLINAIKEQQEIIEDLKTRITKLEN